MLVILIWSTAKWYDILLALDSCDILWEIPVQILDPLVRLLKSGTSPIVFSKKDAQTL